MILSIASQHVRRLFLSRSRFSRRAAALTLLACLSAPAWAADPVTSFKFSFAPTAAPAGTTPITPKSVYSDAIGFGFEPGAKVTTVENPTNPAAGCIASDTPFSFSAKLPEGN